MFSSGKQLKVSRYQRNIDREFYNSFKMFLRINQIFSSAPVNINFFTPTGPQSSNQKTIEKVSSSVHSLFGIVISTLVIWATYLQRIQFDGNVGFLTSLLYLGEYIVGILNLLLIIIGSRYQRKCYTIIFKRLVSVDMNLQKCGVQPNFDNMRITLRRVMISYAMFFVFVIFVDFMYNDMQARDFIRSSTVYTVPNIISTLALTQYSMVIYYARNKFRTINVILKRLISNGNSVGDSQIGNNQLCIISVLGRSRNGTEKILNILRRQHTELSRLVEFLNKCFGVLIVLILVAAYIILSIQFYAFYRITVGFEKVDLWLIAYTILWVILHGGKVLLILYPTHDIIDERKLTGVLLFENDITCKSFDTNTMKTFANQLLHETTPPNACRVINLDLTILGTMLGTLTTYLIILIQFDDAIRKGTESTK